MTDDTRVLSLLTEVLAESPTIAPDQLLASVLTSVEGTSQRRRWPSIQRKVGIGSSPRLGRFTAAAAIAVVVVVVAAIVFNQLMPRLVVPGPGATRSPSVPTATLVPSPSPSPSPSAPPSGSGSDSLVLEEHCTQTDTRVGCRVDHTALLANTPYTSQVYEPSVTFSLRLWSQATDWCWAQTTTRAIVLTWAKPCTSDLRIISPYAVDCGNAGAHPDPASLAAALLANPGLKTHDMGVIGENPQLPANLFLGGYNGRVIRIDGSRVFDSGTTDPDHCRLLPDPQSQDCARPDLCGSQDPTIEIRGDMPTMLILVDVDGELVVMRASDTGYDAATGVRDLHDGGTSIRAFGAQGLFDGIYNVLFH